MTGRLRLVERSPSVREERVLARVSLWTRAGDEGGPRWLVRWGHMPLDEQSDGPTEFALGVFTPRWFVLWRWYG